MIEVWHVGPLQQHGGGIAAVVTRLMASTDLDVVQRRMSTVHTSYLRSALRALRVVAGLFGRRMAGSRLVLHAHVSQGGSFVREGSLARAAAVLGHGVVVHVHGSSFDAYARRRRERVRRVLAAADVVLVLTDSARAAVVDLVPRSTDVVLTHNAVAAVTHTSPYKQRRVLFAGEIGTRKGVDVLLGAWRSAGLVDEGWRLVLAGSMHRDYALPVPLPDGVEHRGLLPPAELRRELEIASVAVLPSRAEAFPMFLAEAMSHAVLPIASDVGDVARLLGGHGRLVPPDQEHLLAEALADVCAMSGDQRLEAGRAAARHVTSHFGAEEQLQTVRKSWERAVRGELREVAA